VRTAQIPATIWRRGWTISGNSVVMDFRAWAVEWFCVFKYLLLLHRLQHE